MNEDAGFYEAFMAHSPRRFFHIDWSGSFSPNTFVRRCKLENRSHADLSRFASELSLEELSTFGEKHLWGDRKEWETACRELACEWIRRERYPNEFSRLHCLFGFEHLDDAKRFRVLHRIDEAGIWSVRAIGFSGKKDMNWFDKPGSLIERLYHADRYWRGDVASDEPAWEILLHPSVFIEERVV